VRGIEANESPQNSPLAAKQLPHVSSVTPLLSAPCVGALHKPIIMSAFEVRAGQVHALTRRLDEEV
jgi:hypothetical protein